MMLFMLYCIVSVTIKQFWFISSGVFVDKLLIGLHDWIHYWCWHVTNIYIFIKYCPIFFVHFDLSYNVCVHCQYPVYPFSANTMQFITSYVTTYLFNCNWQNTLSWWVRNHGHSEEFCHLHSINILQMSIFDSNWN